MSTSKEKAIRYVLGILLLFVAINAFGGGYYAMAGAEGVPVEWLQGSPFTSYYYPGMLLFAGIGGLSLFSAIAVFSKKKIAGKVVLICGLAILLWLGVQVATIGYVSWMQPVTAMIAVLILILNWLHSKKNRGMNISLNKIDFWPELIAFIAN